MAQNSHTPEDLGVQKDPPEQAGDPQESPPKKPRIERGPPVFGKFRIWIVVAPFIIYLCGMMIGGYIEKLRVMKVEGTLHHHETDENRIEIDRSEAWEKVTEEDTFLFGLFKVKYNTYPYTYTFVIALTAAFMIAFGWGYFKVPFRISPWSVVAGVVGIVVWVGVAHVDRTYLHLGESLGDTLGDRPAFNPFEELRGNPVWMWTFLAIRFFGLVVVVSIVEEFFLRGFLMRYVDDPDWDEIPLGVARIGGWISPTIYGLVAHPTEPISALLWFSMVTLLYKKTGSIWDCVVAHAVTNLLLGIYVVQYGAWHLW